VTNFYYRGHSSDSMLTLILNDFHQNASHKIEIGLKTRYLAVYINLWWPEVGKRLKQTPPRAKQRHSAGDKQNFSTQEIAGDFF
jgi:hypothetical protein